MSPFIENLIYGSIYSWDKAKLMILSCQTLFSFLPKPMKSSAMFLLPGLVSASFIFLLNHQGM